MPLGLCTKNLTVSENKKLTTPLKRAENSRRYPRRNHQKRMNNSARSLKRGQGPQDSQQTEDFKEGTPLEKGLGGTRELAMRGLDLDMTKQTRQAGERTSIQTKTETGNHLIHSLGSGNDFRALQDKRGVPLARQLRRDTPGGETDKNTEIILPNPMGADSRSLEKTKGDTETL